MMTPLLVFCLSSSSAMLLLLAPDLLELVADFLQSDLISSVCSTLRGLLGRRHMRVACDAHQVANNVAQHVRRLLTLRVKVLHNPTAVPWMGLPANALRDAPCLHTLVLTHNLFGSPMGDGGARALAALRYAPALRTLTLALPSNDLTGAGAQALAALRDAPALHSLCIDLHMNCIGDTGAQALATLRDCPTLHALTLDLRHNGISDSGARALTALSHAPALHSLDVCLCSAAPERNLRHIRPGPPGAQCGVQCGVHRVCIPKGLFSGPVIQSLMWSPGSAERG